MKAALIFTLCLFVAFAAFGAACPDRASAASFSSKKPEGLMATAAKGKIAVTWEKVKGAGWYLLYEKQIDIGEKPAAVLNKDGSQAYKKVASIKSRKKIRKNLKKGKDYCYYVVACKKVNGKIVKSARSDIRVTTLPKKGKSTIKNLLRTGLAPIGSTMYVWGGGWNKADTGAGVTTRRTGLFSRWRSFAEGKTENYDYTKYLYKINSGLDCSGFAGFCIYNVMNTKNGKKGYVKKSTYMSKWLKKKGLGYYAPASKVKNHKAGDIMSCKGHVWIAIGDCSDGSSVILHSSPPMVSLAGTPSKKGTKNSKAVKLARKYMKKYYPLLYKKYPNMIYRDKSYLKEYNRMRWNTGTLSDPDGYKKMNASKVLADLFSER